MLTLRARAVWASLDGKLIDAGVWPSQLVPAARTAAYGCRRRAHTVAQSGRLARRSTTAATPSARVYPLAEVSKDLHTPSGDKSLSWQDRGMLTKGCHWEFIRWTSPLQSADREVG